MNVAVIRACKETEWIRHCDNCENKDGYGKLEIKDTKKFLMLQLFLFDEQGQKSTKTYITLKNLEISVGV